MAGDVFISHSSTDAGKAAEICAAVEAAGRSCWIAPRDMRAGRSWGENIIHALDSCTVLLLVLTQRANASRQVLREVERADGKGARIVTLRLDPMPLSPTLEYFLSLDHWLDATRPPLQQHLPALLKALETSTLAPQRARRAAAAQRSDQELLAEFDELAPDDWNLAPRSRVGRFFQQLFADR